MEEEQQELFQQDVKTRQGKLKYLFEREDQNNGAKKHVHKTETSSEITCIEKFYYPKILLERYTKNSFVKYDLYNTNSDMYTPVSDEHIELCMEHGLAVYSRTLRISSKKKAIKKILKTKNRPENYEEIVESLSKKIDSIYLSGKTINLNLIK
tara:strand:- start:1071 stop:1529 length:459 start_codon:yes stop_codon:yes gene_type:complete